MNHLISYLPSTGVIRRHHLLTGKQEQVDKLELPAGDILAFCMGHASAGPLLVGVAGQAARLFDPATFKEIPLPTEGQPVNAGPPRLEGGNYWAGATGRVFGNTGNIINTSLTADSQGNIYFGYRNGSTGGIAKVTPTGGVTTVAANVAAGDAGINWAQNNEALALSNDEVKKA